MATPKLYLETSVVSYLTAQGSRDLILAAHQEVTRAWWASREGFDVYASQFVLDEASAGDTEAAARRLQALEGVPLLDVTADVIALAERLLADHGLPSKARLDALHVAAAAVHGMDYLLSWNCKHIANALLRSKIESICRAEGFEPLSFVHHSNSLRNEQCERWIPSLKSCMRFARRSPRQATTT